MEGCCPLSALNGLLRKLPVGPLKLAVWFAGSTVVIIGGVCPPAGAAGGIAVEAAFGATGGVRTGLKTGGGGGVYGVAGLGVMASRVNAGGGGGIGAGGVALGDAISEEIGAENDCGGA